MRRDTLGHYLAEILWRMSPDFLDYGVVAKALLTVDRDENNAAYADLMIADFSRRGIVPAPAMIAMKAPRRLSSLRALRSSRVLRRAGQGNQNSSQAALSLARIIVGGESGRY